MTTGLMTTTYSTTFTPFRCIDMSIILFNIRVGDCAKIMRWPLTIHSYFMIGKGKVRGSLLCSLKGSLLCHWLIRRCR